MCEKVVEKLALPLGDPYKVFDITTGNQLRNSIVKLLDADWCVRNLHRNLVPKVQQIKDAMPCYFGCIENLKNLEQACMKCELGERMLLSAEKGSRHRVNRNRLTLRTNDIPDMYFEASQSYNQSPCNS
ncbi:hypothetical protein TRICI_000672 [Trichomonascus ciferrii]|uniref:Uncharacterized protein n=1 Tax=Trichomonascus ciferrii TaxID=44093 RepID=A0A642VBM2_9ASCO|nr:hypothetical protein TRICI_000672 [Trichomonascus ciferrii]